MNQSMEQMVTAANGAVAPLRVKAREQPPPALEIEMQDEKVLRYALVVPTAEQLLATKRKFETLAGEDAFEARTWSELLATFLVRADAVRFLKEQTIATVQHVLQVLTERTVKDLSPAK